MVWHLIWGDILLTIRNFLRSFTRAFGARINTTSLTIYPQVLNVKPPNKVYIHNILTGMVQYLSIQAKADIEEGPNIEQSS